MKRLDITGEKYGALTALRYVRTTKGRACWLCRCDCGATVEAQSANMRSGNTTSCGCRKGAGGHRIKMRHGHARHGRLTPEYISWRGMYNRCFDTRRPDYNNYGGRGISVCERWRKFEAFLSDMGQKPTPKHSIDRINNDGNYEPGNCRWATSKEQSANRRNSRRAA